MLLVMTNVNVLSGLKCVCNPEDCDLIRQSDCPGKGSTIWDACKYVQQESNWAVSKVYLTKVVNEKQWKLINDIFPYKSY